MNSESEKRFDSIIDPRRDWYKYGNKENPFPIYLIQHKDLKISIVWKDDQRKEKKPL